MFEKGCKYQLAATWGSNAWSLAYLRKKSFRSTSKVSYHFHLGEGEREREGDGEGERGKEERETGKEERETREGERLYSFYRAWLSRDQYQGKGPTTPRTRFGGDTILSHLLPEEKNKKEFSKR